MTRSTMRIAVVQFAPKIGKVQENIETARRLCQKLDPHSVDLVCLPEMIFTGYVFSNAAAISPHLEQPGSGPTSRFCAELAARLRCYVAAGYPERLDLSEVEIAAGEDGEAHERVGANSAVLYGPDGTCIGGYRKTNLYETDKTWAKPGNGFATFTLPPPLNTVTLGICMDLNPQSTDGWTLTEGPYEIADFCAAQKSRLLILLNAWLESGSDLDEAKDWQTINYWAARLRPLWAKNWPAIAGSDVPTETETETAVVVCNRCGEENGKTFAGSSSLFLLTPRSGRPHLLTAMDRHQEDVAVWTIQL